MTKQRLRKQELVTLVFQLFWEEAHRLGRSSIQSLVIPLDRVRRELADRTGAPRQNSKWIYTQIRKYEEREGVVLFGKTRDDDGDEALKVTEDLLTFVQKRHLHRAEKIRLANGVADFIESEIAVDGRIATLFLGAGTTVAHIAEVLQGRAADSTLRLDVTTHNMGVIEVLARPNRAGESIRLSIAPGRFDPITYTILPDEPEPMLEWEFDLVVQGASAVYDGRVYIESDEELARKRTVLHECNGLKLLVLTLHEFYTDLPQEMRDFGALDDFDVIVVPKVKRPLENQERGLSYLHSVDSTFRAAVTGWHYEIFTRTAAPVAHSLPISHRA